MIKTTYGYSPAQLITTKDPTIKLPSDLVVNRSTSINLLVTFEIPDSELVLLESCNPGEYSISPRVVKSGEPVTIFITNHLNDRLVRYSGDPIAELFVVTKSKAMFIKEKE